MVYGNARALLLSKGDTFSMMNFLFTINDKYIQPIETLIFTIEINNKSYNKSYYFIYNDISIENQKRISEYVTGFGSKASFIKFEWDGMDSLQVHGTWSKEVYFRLFAPYLLPDIDVVLYLDGDTIVDDNLCELFSVDISRFAFAAVANDEESSHIIRLNKDLKKYYNSGVLLMNLKEIRNQISFKEMKDAVINSTNNYIFPDQDFINVVFCEKIYELAQKYNYMINLLERKSDYTKLNKYTICHFVLQKPWNYEFPYLTDRKYLLYLIKKGNFCLAIKLWYHHRKYRLSIKIKGR